MADETNTLDTKALPPASPVTAPALAPAPVPPLAPTPDATPAKATKAKATAPEAPKSVTVINETQFRFRLGVLDGSDCLIVPGENKDVDADMFGAWSKQNADSDLVKNGLVRTQ